MIDESRTLEIYGYTSGDLSEVSHNPIVVICEDCGKYRVIRRASYRDLCLSCSKTGVKASTKTKNKMSETRKGKDNAMYGIRKYGKDNPFYGKRHNKNTIKKMVDNRGDMSGENNPMYGVRRRGKDNPNYGKNMSEETKRKISEANTGRLQTEEHKRKNSAAQQGISLKDWQGYIQEKPYCEKFNESCRERNREKYMRTCFICGKDEVLNGQKLSVHHVDRNKDQGCNDHDWSLVPLCKKHHGSCHNDLWESRIMYLLNHVWVAP